MSNLIDLIQHSLNEDQASNLVHLSFPENSFIDGMVIATGRSSRHSQAIVEHLVERIKPMGLGHVHIEGFDQGQWILVDLGSILVHVFQTEFRDIYKLETLWSFDQ
jgi:ribosome-associated protein